MFPSAVCPHDDAAPTHGRHAGLWPSVTMRPCSLPSALIHQMLPPVPPALENAIVRPSGDQAGLVSPRVDLSVTRPDPSAWTTTSELVAHMVYSSRQKTVASLRPSGDQAGW